MSSQIDAKKKLMKVKKPTYKALQISQNIKKNIKILDHPPKNDNNINNNINSTILNHNNNNNAKTIQKLQEELNIYKDKSEKLEEEIMKLNLKIKEMTEKNEKIAKKNEEEKNSEEDSSFSSQKKNPLKKAISSAYDILIELVELILNQKTYKDKDKDKDKENNSTQKQIENISMDIYEPSVYNDEERKSLLFEQIQQILIFKINFINKIYHLGLEKQCERIKNWNLNSINTTKDNNKDISFLSFSAFSNNKKRSHNVSMSNSDIALGIGITPPHSPKFPGRKDSYSAISNIMDESTIKDLSTSIINYNNAPHFGLGGDSFFFENENLSKSKEDIDVKDHSKGKEVNLINTSFKDLSLIRSGDEQALGNVSFTKNLDKYPPNMEGGENDNDINSGDMQNKEIIIKNENQFDISFNDI
jgi:hypothetical protein